MYIQLNMESATILIRCYPNFTNVSLDSRYADLKGADVIGEFFFHRISTSVKMFSYL